MESTASEFIKNHATGSGLSQGDGTDNILFISDVEDLLIGIDNGTIINDINN